MRPYKTLIIEDDPSVLKELTLYLKEYNRVISINRSLTNCKEAIDVLIDERFDISILDIDLLDGDCFEIIQKVPRQRFGEIVFFTSYGGLFINQMFKAGPIFYLEKPFSPNQTQEMVLYVDDYLSKMQTPLKFVELFTKHRGKKIIVSMEDILYLEYTPNPNIVTYYFRELNPNFSEIDKRKYIFSDAVGGSSLLDQIRRLTSQFTQCNRNCILNLEFLKIYSTNSEEGIDVEMPNGELIKISRGFRKNVFARKGIS